MTDLLFLAGLLLSQALTFNDTEVVAAPTGVIDVYGQAHVLKFEEQGAAEALYSVEAALMMHARDANRYGLVEPAGLGNATSKTHVLHVSERGSVGDLTISFSLGSTESASGTTTVGFNEFEIQFRGKTVSANDYPGLRAELQRGYQSLSAESSRPLPPLPQTLLQRSLMI